MKWISVKDRLPENDENVLCWTSKFGWAQPERIKDGSWEVLFYTEGKWFGEWSCIGEYENNADYWMVTHWMPLPEPPK